MLKSPIYLVPYDFSEVSEKASRLAIDLAHANNGSVMLIHVVSKRSEKHDAHNKFKELAEKLEEKDIAVMSSRVLVGDLFEDIGKAGELLSPELIVMGTHGAHGLQKVFGSNAIKMISNSSSPFLITQGKKTVEKIKTIVMPFSFNKNSIQITKFAGSIAKRFDATIHLLGYHDKDEWLEKHMKANQNIVRQHLDEIGVKYEIANISSAKNYNNELLAYARNVDADLLAAGYFQEGIITNPKSFIQFMIENELHLPLLTVNAEDLFVANKYFMFHA